MKLLNSFVDQIKSLGELRYVWLTSFNINIEFIETYLLPAVLGMEQPKARSDYEHLQIELTQKNIDFRIFCDKRFMGADKNKRTGVPVHGVSPAKWEKRFSNDSLFHPKVIYLEDVKGNRILGTGSANLTLSGWGRNQEVFSFQTIETKEQYDAVKLFFGEIAANVDLTHRLPDRRGLSRAQGDWSFIHSFQDRPFIAQLFDNTNANELLVWSPYLSKDMVAFVKRLANNVSTPGLKIHLVPDLVNGQFIRTRWTDSLQKMTNDGVLTFYRNPSALHDSVELCHAKVWKLGSKLAIGSWNFTVKGANLLDQAGRSDKGVNIEAGVIVTDTNSWRSAVGKKIDVTDSAFASDELLSEEALDVPDQLPFDIYVEFDWREQSYNFNGQWHTGEPKEGFFLKVPGHRDSICLDWKPRKKELKSQKKLSISDPRALLHERRFQVIRDGSEVYRALVTETELTYRRCQAFESMDDLLNAFLFDGAPRLDNNIPFRLPVDESSIDLAEGFGDTPQGDLTQTKQAISYFRMFQATHQYGKKLEAINNVLELNSWVFARPGCLVELVEKTNEKVIVSEPTLFNWFLAQEVRGLCQKAELKRGELGKEGDSMPDSRWNELRVNIPCLPQSIQPDYVNFIQKECKYVGR